MKHLLILLCLLSLSAQAQQLRATRVYPAGSRIAIADSTGTRIGDFPADVVTVSFTPDNIRLNYQSSGGYLNPAQFLDVNGTPYGATVAAASAAWDRAKAPVRSLDVDINKLITAPMLPTAKASGAINTPRAAASAGGNAVSTLIEPGKKYYLKGVQVFCDRPYYVGVTVRKQGASNFNNQSESVYFTLGDKETSVVLPYDELLFENGLVTLSATPLAGTSQDQGYIGMRLIGRTQSLFEIDNPDYRIVVLADSKALYTLPNGDYGERYYPNQLARALQAQGKRVSIIDKTMPGASSSDMVRMIKSGALDGIKYDLLIVAYGTNNSTATATAPVIAQFKADLAEAILHRNRTNPSASILFSTPGVTDKTSLLTNIDAYRTAVADLTADAVLGGSSRRVYLCQEHLAFTPSATVKSDRFIASEALNNQLHYSMLGHDDVYTNRFLPAVKTTDFWLNALKLNP